MQFQSLNAKSLPLRVAFTWHTIRKGGCAMTAFLRTRLNRGHSPIIRLKCRYSFQFSYFIFLVLLLFAVSQAQATTVTITTTRAGAWTVPTNVTSVTVQVWGAGGAGGGNATTSDGGGGAGGGGYSTSTVAVSGSVSYFVGAGGAGVLGGTGSGGGNTNFGAVAANGGAGGQPPSGGNGGVGGAGGAGSTFNGGNGGTGENAGTGDGAPGGSSAGTAASGTNGPTTWSTVTAAAAPAGGGIGGNGGTATNNGSAPASGNGGGGGGSGDKSSSGSTNRTGGAGAGGKIIITYKTNQTITFGSAPTVVVGGSGTVTATGGASGNPVTFTSLTTSICTVSGTNGSTVTGVAVGTCTIAANQTGDATNYYAAAQVTQNMTVGMGSQTITFGAAPTVVVGGTGTVSATGGASGNPVTFTSTTTGVCTVSGTNGSTVTGVAVGTCIIAANQLGNANYNAAPQVTQNVTVSPPFCSPPSNIPAGLTVSCQCDTFARASLQPSTIFNSNWNVSTSDTTGILPSIVNPGYLRLTNNTGNNAKAATVPGIFPAAGNYISVEFQQYAYNGTGADGIAVTLSDYSVAAVPGAYGGSLGYAQETGIHDGFAGGWLGVALDEYGNYQSSTEGRLGGACTTSACMPQSVGARGSGAGQTGYRWLGGTSSLSPTIDNRTSTSPSLGYYYQVIVDARNDPTSTAIAVNRDIGSGYTSLINIPNVYSAATGQGFTQAPVPANWQISFTGSTGGSTNIHEIGGLRICASTMVPPSGGTAGSFNAIDEGYGTPPLAVQNYLSSGGAGHIYTKVVGTPFKLNVAALSSGQLLTTYAFTSSKSVAVNLVENSDGACILDSTKANYCNSTCTGKTVVPGGTQTLTFATGATDKGQKQSPSFTINSAYKNLVAIISDGTTTACSTDAFAVRPTALTLATTATATASGGTPVLKAGTDSFTLNVSAASTAYTGTPTIGSIDTSQMGGGTWVAGSLSVGATLAAAVSGVSTNNSTYSEVGLFKLAGYGAGNDTLARGVFDASWTAVDSVGATADCVAGSYSNAKDVNGKYGCNFGLVADATFGRFIPDHFGIAGSVLTRSDLQATEAQALPFTYMGEPMKLALTVTAYNKSEAPMQNYKGSFAKLDATTLGSADLSKWSCTSGVQCMGLAANFGATSLTSRLAIDTTSTNSALPINTTTAGGVTSGWSGGTSYFTLYSTFARATAPDGAYGDGSTTFLKIGGKPLDSDGVTIPPRNLAPTATNELDCVNLDVTTGAEDATCNPGPTEVNLRRKLFNTTLRYGRLQLQNIYGSERLPLVIPMQAQYWNGGYFVNNADDSLAPLPGVPPASQTLAAGAVPAGVPGVYFYPITTRNLLLSSDVAPTLCTTTGAPSGALCGSVGVATSKLAGGQAKLQFLAPASNHPGWLDIILPVPGYLLYNWGNCDGQPGVAGLNNDYPCARATFGTYKSPLIYRRENY